MLKAYNYGTLELGSVSVLKMEQRWEKFLEGLSQPCYNICQSLTYSVFIGQAFNRAT